jgi:beta-glucosidase
MVWTAEHAPAILHITHSGQEMGTALAGALFGDINPGGRLVQTWPRSMDQLPQMMDYDIRHGRTYMYFTGKALYPFGCGLSYTTFNYSNLRLSAPKMGAAGEMTINFDLTNSGARTGDEVTQLYVKYLNSKVEMPLKALKGFKRITLKPGETKKMDFTLRAKDLAYWKEKSGGPFEGSWEVEPGKIQVLIGSSSADSRLQGDVEITE